MLILRPCDAIALKAAFSSTLGAFVPDQTRPELDDSCLKRGI